MAGRFQRESRLRIEQLERRELLSVGASGLLPSLVQGVAATAGDDFGNTFALASQVNLSSTGTGSQSGKIEKSGDVDMFSFVAPVTGKMTITESATSGSRLDSYLYVYQGNQQLLARNDDSASTLNSRVVINVVAGTTYYLKAAAYQRSTGAYSVQFTTAVTTDDYAGTFAQATAVSLSSAGAGSQSGKVEQSGDVDMFSFVATVTGQMTITQSAATGSTVDSYLYVYDSNQQLLAHDDDSGGARNSQVEISVVAGTTYYVKAAAYQTSTGAYSLTFSTTEDTSTDEDTPADDDTSDGGTSSTGGFQIDVTMSGFTASQQAIIQQAVDRWEEIIVGDVADVYSGRVIDDVEISLSALTIDGTGNILGQSAVTAVRSGSGLPYLGYIQLDTADVASMQSEGSLLGVLEHEIAHVLGFGVIWSDLGLLTGTRSNPGFSGTQAVAEYNAIFGTSATSVPVEADGGSGTALSHWDESVFGSELMTGWYNSGQTNALSRITVASMADLGYQVNMDAADSYTRPTSTAAASAAIVGTQPASRFSGFSTLTSSRTRSDRLAALDGIFAGLYSGRSV